MIYPYTVKHNGVWYSPGQLVPDQATTPDETPVPEGTEQPVTRRRGRPPKRRD